MKRHNISVARIMLRGLAQTAQVLVLALTLALMLTLICIPSQTFAQVYNDEGSIAEGNITEENNALENIEQWIAKKRDRFSPWLSRSNPRWQRRR